MQITSNPQLRLPREGDSDSSKGYPFMDYSSKKYYTIIKESKIITFDSGESSNRRDYIAATLSYLLNIKGIPSVVLSTLDPTVTRLFLNRIPQNLRRKILNIGLFHTYLKVQQNFRSILEQLCLSKEYRPYMELFFSAMRSIETDLLKQISDLGVLCILDRSLVSNYLYAKIITENQKVQWNWDQIYNLREFKPYYSFFIHSLSDKPTSFNLGSMYDTEEGINQSLRGVLPLIKKDVPIVELDTHLTFEQNMSVIKSTLANL